LADHKHPVDPERVQRARRAQLTRAEAEELSALLGIIGEPVRSRILSALLAGEEMCVGDLAMALDLSEDAVSYGLRILRRRGLVERRAAGRLGYYRVVDGPQREPLLSALERLAELARAPQTRPGDRDG
jgi:DNA-binding transcriptional ArsR family regulator